MNVAMFTNAYEPVIGGVERSIATFSEDLRELGHNVLVVTLKFPGAMESEDDVFRLPALQEIGGTEFSLKLPVPAGLRARIEDFSPDVIHSHHPFMLGDTALRIARERRIPLLFTHHTLYERYAYLFSPESVALERVAQAIATEYANLCDTVIAPTPSIAELIRSRGVNVPVEVVPTGVDTNLYGRGCGTEFRSTYDIPKDAFVLGYVGRVVEAKNMAYLTEVAVELLHRCPDTWYLVVGDGECLSDMRERFTEEGLSDRTVFTGSITGSQVADAYAAMNVFAFASKTDTQGIVLVESLSAGTPVVALDTTGPRDIIRDGQTGLLLPENSEPGQFAEALFHIKKDPVSLNRWRSRSRQHAAEYNRRRCAQRLDRIYQRVAAESGKDWAVTDPPVWDQLQQQFEAEWDLLKAKFAVLVSSIS